MVGGGAADLEQLERAAAPLGHAGEHLEKVLAAHRARAGARDQDPARLDVPQALRDVTYFVSQREFRLDISSTELRRAAAGVDA